MIDWPATSVDARAYIFLLGHRVSQRSYSVHDHLHRLSRKHRADALGCARGDQVARHKCNNLGKEANDNIEREDEIPRVALLANGSIDSGFHANSRPRIDFVGDQRPHRAESVEAL